MNGALWMAMLAALSGAPADEATEASDTDVKTDAGADADADADTDADWAPAAAPPPTAWARSGARAWNSCLAAGRQAAVARTGTRARGDFDRGWSARAQRCPGVPSVLVIAGQEALLKASPTGWMPEEGGIEDAVLRQHEYAQAAAELFDAAIEEAARRGDAPPPEAHYYRAYAASVLGDVSAVREHLAIAAEVGDAERWRIDRMAAVAALFDGDLDAALRRAHLAVVDTPPNASDRQMSRYIWALVLDRAGSPAAARRVLRQLRREPGHSGARRDLETVLPAHERIYLRAIEHQAHGETTNAVRLWDAYLARPEPKEADRELAQRHKGELPR